MAQIIRNRNELMQGASPEAIATLKNFDSNQIPYYTEGYYDSTLANTLSERFGVSRERIIVSYGAEDFLRTTFDSLDPETDSILTHEYYYGYYKVYLDGKGVKLHTFKMREEVDTFSFEIKDCIEQYEQQRSKVIVITSPNNPTGNSITPNDLEEILKAVSPETLIILDEAYWGFDPEYDQQAFLGLLERYPNLAILRSFSKYYALAGLRIGFALCGANVKKILRYQDLYLGMSRLLEEVAIAALKSEKYYSDVAKQIEDERNRLTTEINSLQHFKAYTSKANLVFMRADEEASAELEQALSKVEVLSAKKSYGNYWRITVGLPEVNSQLIRVLKHIDFE